jgi:hypothetical protein
MEKPDDGGDGESSAEDWLSWTSFFFFFGGIEETGRTFLSSVMESVRTIGLGLVGPTGCG